MIQFLYINDDGQRVYRASSLKDARAFTSSFGTHGAFYYPGNLCDDKGTGYTIHLCK